MEKIYGGHIDTRGDLASPPVSLLRAVLCVRVGVGAGAGAWVRASVRVGAQVRGRGCVHSSSVAYLKDFLSVLNSQVGTHLKNAPPQAAHLLAACSSA